MSDTPKPKQHSCWLDHESVLVMKADEAIAYAEARHQEGIQDAIDLLEKLHAEKVEAVTNNPTLDGAAAILANKHMIKELRKLKEGK